MPKRIEPIILKETDETTLRSIVSGQTPSGQDIQKRAHALLLLSEGHRVKEVAGIVGMRENSITDIRRRFEERGMDSLVDMKRSGRPVDEDAKIELERKVQEMLSRDENGSLSAKGIAKAIGISEYSVRGTMERLGLIEGRTRSWDIRTSDGSAVACMELTGVYLSASQLIIAVTVQKDLLEIESTDSSGKIHVRDRVLSNALSEYRDSEGCIQLAKAIEVYSQRSVGKQSQSGDAFSFIRSLEEHGSGDSLKELHVFACGSPITDSARSLLSHTILHSIQDKKQWMSQTENLLSMLCRSENGFETMISICNAIEMYIHNATMQTACFQWKSIGEKSAGSTAYDNEMEKETVTPGTIEYTARIMGDDGQWITCRTTADMHFMQKEFDTSSTEKYLASFHVVEQAIADMSQQTAKALSEKYAAEAVKKKNGIVGRHSSHKAPK